MGRIHILGLGLTIVNNWRKFFMLLGQQKVHTIVIMASANIGASFYHFCQRRGRSQYHSTQVSYQTYSVYWLLMGRLHAWQRILDSYKCPGLIPQALWGRQSTECGQWWSWMCQPLGLKGLCAYMWSPMVHTPTILIREPPCGNQQHFGWHEEMATQELY